MSEEREGMWVTLELMGHRRLFGFLSEEALAGTSFLRVDIYAGDAQAPVVTQFYTAKSVYCITPTDETLCRQMAHTHKPTPVSRYELPQIEQGQSIPGGNWDDE